VNISEGFIKRPIATSLLMAAIALFGLVAIGSCRSATSQRRFPDAARHGAAGANPETMGALGGDPARKSLLDPPASVDDAA
jgi:HAE1 family hydrophobic/amphiphilic exporter-1